VKKQLLAVAAAALVAGACTAGSDDTTGGTTAGPAATDVTAPSATFPADDRADGVTDDTIRLGVTYVDLESLGDIVNIDHGDYEAAYQAVADAINADGGIHGRQLELVFAPVTPIGTDDADAECVHLTEDEHVFAVLGFVIDDMPLCYVALHDTPLIGGVVTEERLGQAEAPWFSNIPGAESITARLVGAYVEAGVFDDATVGVISLPAEQGLLDDVTVPALEAAGIEPVETATIDAPDGDQAAALAQVAVIAERFDAAGVDTIVTVGNAALTTAQGLAPLAYRPRLVGTGFESVATYIAAEEGFDPTVVEGAVTGGYATAGVQYDDPLMADCVADVEAATGETVPDPDDLNPGEPEPYVSVFAACMQLDLFRQIAEAAGEDLDNGTFGNAGYGLGEIELPGAAGPATYGPDSLDGSMPIYLLRFDDAEGRLLSDTEPVS
jgi:hypothetical protein